MPRQLLLPILGLGLTATWSLGPRPANGAPPAVSLSDDWQIVEQSDHHLVLRYKTSNEGVRINLAVDDRGRQPGVALVLNGRTWEVQDADLLHPAWGLPYLDRPPSQIDIISQGPDLLIELRGPPLSTLVEHPEAPDDPVLSRLRIRPRPQSWRVITQGLHVWSLPARELQIEHLGDRRIIRSQWGTLTLEGAPARARSVGSPDRLWIDTTPSAEAFDPYPRIGLTVPVSP